MHGRPGHTQSSVMYGGTVIDADIQRTQLEFRSGAGLDQLMEIGVLMDLTTPKPLEEALAAEDRPTFEILRAEATEEGGALLRVRECIEASDLHFGRSATIKSSRADADAINGDRPGEGGPFIWPTTK